MPLYFPDLYARQARAAHIPRCLSLVSYFDPGYGSSRHVARGLIRHGRVELRAMNTSY